MPHDADEMVLEQRLNAHFRPGVPDDADLQVDQPLAQRPDILVGLWREAQAYAGRRLPRRGDEPAGERVHETLIGADREDRSSDARSSAFGRRARAQLRTSLARSPTRARNAAACGVGTNPRPARTSSGSPVAARRRASVRLIAEALRPSLPRSARTRCLRRAKRRAQRAGSSRSRPSAILPCAADRSMHGMALHATINCVCCAFRYVRMRLSSPTTLFGAAMTPHRDMSTAADRDRDGGSPDDGMPPRQRALVVTAVLAAIVLVVLDAAIANVALPTLATALHVSPPPPSGSSRAIRWRWS